MSKNPKLNPICRKCLAGEIEDESGYCRPCLDSIAEDEINYQAAQNRERGYFEEKYPQEILGNF